MAKKILVSYDFSKLELLNVRIQNLASDPASPVEGQLYWNTASKYPAVHNGTSFINLLSRANHTGTQTASTISDFNTAVRTNTLTQMAVPTADLSIAGFKLTSVADGTAATDAATYGQLMNVSNGTDWKASVRVLANTNVATLSGLLTIDGVTLVANDRVALTGQTTTSANGIYSAQSGAWTRATDSDGNTEVTPGMAFFVEEGTTYADSQWRLTTNGAIVVGTTGLTFAQIGAAVSYTNGTGIGLAGNVFSIDTAVVTRKFAQNIGDNSATSITVTHGLSTLDVQVQVVEVSSGATVECDVTRGSTTQVTLGFAVAPTSNQYRVIVQG